MVILVNNDDLPIGVMEKLEAHEKGLLHRAFSVVILNSAGEMLLQRRADNKYHSGRLWTNACCSHPAPGKTTEEAARHRLAEEMGIRAELHYIASFIYKAALDNGLTEHEFDHIYVGRTDSVPVPDPEEVSEYRYVSQDDLIDDIDANPENYTEWFKIMINRFGEELFKNNK